MPIPIDEIKALLKSGKSVRDVAKLLNIPAVLVFDALKCGVSYYMIGQQAIPDYYRILYSALVSYNAKGKLAGTFTKGDFSSMLYEDPSIDFGLHTAHKLVRFLDFLCRLNALKKDRSDFHIMRLEDKLEKFYERP